MLMKSLLLFSVNVSSRGFQYLYRVVMSNFLTLKEFGILSASLPYLSFVLLFTSMTITPTVSKFTSQYRIKEKEKIFSVFFLVFLGIFVGVILYFSTGFFSVVFGAEFTGSENLLKVLAASVPFAVVLSICTGIFLGYEKAHLMALSLVLYECTMLVSSCVLVQYTGLNGAVQGILLGYIIGGVTALVLVFRFQLPVTPIVKEGVKILKFAVPVLMGVIGLWALLNVDVLVLARFVPAEEVGLYGRAYPTARLTFGFSMALSALLVPKISELTQRKADITPSFQSSFEICSLVTLPISMLMIAFSKEILYVLFGAPDGYTSLMILSVGMLFYSLFFVGYSTLQGSGHPAYSMGIAVTAAIINIFLCLKLIPLYGMEGAAAATSISCVLSVILILGFLKIPVVPRIHYGVVLLPIFLVEHVLGIVGGRISTMIVYGAIGLPFIILYFCLSRKYLHVQE
jgi:stage V sporulation protein B